MKKRKASRKLERNMSSTNSKNCDTCGSKCGSSGMGCGGCSYFLGFLGAAIYYISTATGFWMGFLGVLKALVWPAFLVFEALKYIGA